MTINLFGQEASGLFYGNYNGLSSASINPTFVNKSPFKWELQIIGAQLFAQTNYGSIRSTNTFHLLNNADLVSIPEDLNTTSTSSLAVNFSNTTRRKHFNLQSSILGPGILLGIGNSKIGLSTKFRTYASSYKIPPVLNYRDLQTGELDSELLLKPFDINAAAWLEINGHYVYNIGHQSIGITAKYIKGYAGAYLSNDKDFGFINIPGDTIVGVLEGQFQLGYTDGIDKTSQGFGIDIGWNQYDKKTKTDVGVSILDVGYINFSGKTYQINTEENKRVYGQTYSEFSELDQFLNQLQEDEIAIDSSANFRLLLPTAISIQFSTQLYENYFVGGSIVQRIKVSKKQIARANNANITPYYDSKLFSAFLPFTLYDYRYLRVGTAIRFAFLTIGSDDLFSLISKEKKYNGTDIYLKLNLFQFWNKKAAKMKKDKAKGKSIQCYF